MNVSTFQPSNLKSILSFDTVQVIKARAALLSDFEVLQQFQSQHEDNKKITEAIAEQKAALKAKQDDDWKSMRKYDSMKPEKVQEQKNLAVRGVTDDFLFVTEQASTVRFWPDCMLTHERQINAYLTGPLSVAKQQNPHGIQKLLQGLPQFKLTKAEELQIINLAPKKIIELYLVSAQILVLEFFLTWPSWRPDHRRM
jgi:hypothetical protein